MAPLPEILLSLSPALLVSVSLSHTTIQRTETRDTQRSDQTSEQFLSTEQGTDCT